MKKLFKILTLFLGVTLISTGCNDKVDETEINLSAYSILSRDADLSSLKAAVDRAGLATTLDAAGDYTIFAPSNTAFNTFLQENAFSNLNEVPVPLLKKILLNHVLAKSVKSNQITGGYVKTLAMSEAAPSMNLSMFLNVNSGVTINGVSNVTKADIVASNGVIHKVDAVISLPTVVTQALANPDFTSLKAALTRSDMPNFVQILSGKENSPFTVFAPTNAAFSSLLTELSLTQLSAIDQPTLENALKYHVVAGANVSSMQLTENMQVNTFQGSSFKINLTGGPKITDAKGRVAKIIMTDIQCDNGIIHVIDKVLLP